MEFAEAESLGGRGEDFEESLLMECALGGLFPDSGEVVAAPLVEVGVDHGIDIGGGELVVVAALLLEAHFVVALDELKADQVD